jgi:hypothetical protein
MLLSNADAGFVREHVYKILHFVNMLPLLGPEMAIAAR